MADIEKTWQLLQAIAEKPKLYYALSEYLPQGDGYYKIKTSEGDLWAMHPSQFPQFEFYATQAGYRLIDIRQAPPNVFLPRMRIDAS